MLRLCSVTLVKMHLVIYSKLSNEPNMTFKHTNPTNPPSFLILKCSWMIRLITSKRYSFILSLVILAIKPYWSIWIEEEGWGSKVESIENNFELTLLYSSTPSPSSLNSNRPYMRRLAIFIWVKFNVSLLGVRGYINSSTTLTAASSFGVSVLLYVCVLSQKKKWTLCK